MFRLASRFRIVLFQIVIKHKEVIERISGGDETKGSYSSVALIYIGNKNGLNV